MMGTVKYKSITTPAFYYRHYKAVPYATRNAFRDTELVDLGAKPECLEFLTKAGRIPVFARLMMMTKERIDSRQLIRVDFVRKENK